MTEPSFAAWAALPAPRPLAGAPPAVVGALGSARTATRVVWTVVALVCLAVAATGQTPGEALARALGPALVLGLPAALLARALLAGDERSLRSAPIQPCRLLRARAVSFVGYRGARYEGLELCFGRGDTPEWWVYPGTAAANARPGDTAWLIERAKGAWVFGVAPEALTAVARPRAPADR